MRYIYCHPLFDERKCAHRFSYQLSKAFEKYDLQLERFDYRGTGEEEGQFCDVTMNSLRNDLSKIIDGDKVCLIGTRFGATLAFDYCCRSESNVHTLVLVEPVVNGKTYTEYLFKKQRLKDLMTGNSSESLKNNCFYNLEGFKTNKQLIQQVEQVQLNEAIHRIKVNGVFIVQISTSSRINSEYELLTKLLLKNGIRFGVEIVNLPVFWERIPDGNYSMLSKYIMEWCR